MFFLMFVAASLAADPGITQIPEGTLLTLPGKPAVKVEVFSYLLPEDYYDEALSKAKQLDVCRTSFDRCTTMTSAWIGVADRALASCSDQFTTDEQTVETLRQQVVDEAAKRAAAEERLHDVRGQRNTAWAIAGGLVLGAVAVTAVAIGS
jgi:hypothetical protein